MNFSRKEQFVKTYAEISHFSVEFQTELFRSKICFTLRTLLMESERVAVDVNMTVKFWWILSYVIFRLGRFRVCSLLIENVRSVFSSATKAFGSVCRSLKRNILIFFSLTKFLKSVLSIEIWPKRLFENLRKLPKMVISDQQRVIQIIRNLCGLIPSSSFFARRKFFVCDG